MVMMQSETQAKLLDGKALADRLSQSLKEQIQGLPRMPGLHVVMVGQPEDSPSRRYVRNKLKRAKFIGIEATLHDLPAETSQQDVLDLLARLNADDTIDGIIVQLPVPNHINEHAVTMAIDPAKDVDGFHYMNLGKLMAGVTEDSKALIPCTPRGCMHLIREAVPDITGLHAVVVGRSNIVGKPMAQLLLNDHCTISVVHSRTMNPEVVTNQADILVVAVGKANLVTGEWIKPGAVVIDVGINVAKDGKLVGDVHFESAAQKARAITPVPGGVGPMTVACLMENTVMAARQRTR